MGQLRGICVGAGYFSQFHLDAWDRISEVQVVGVCDKDPVKAAKAAAEFGIPRHGTELAELLHQGPLDFVDIITPPDTHLALVEQVAAVGTHILCQKPLAPTLDEARKIVASAARRDVRLMVHENFRFQPWHRQIKRLIGSGAIGDRLHSLAFRCRMGDGWKQDAYLGRQPYFRTMPRLLVYETGVHYVDTFRYLAGEIDGVYAILRRLNSAIQGEDTGLLIFEFASGAIGVWDASRYQECNDPDPRYTFGEFLVEGSGGSIRLYLDGRLTVQPLGEPERDHPYFHQRRAFAGDCVHAALRHFVDSVLSGEPFQTDGTDYIRTLRVQEAVYQSAEERRPIRGLSAENCVA